MTAVLNSDPVTLGTLTASSTGLVTGSLTVPSSVPAGAHQLVLTGTDAAGLSRTVRAPVTITGATTTSTTSGANQLPKTGSSTRPLVIWSVLLMMFGSAAVLLGQSPRFQQPETR